jgi:membrane fusion protein (multidrug efflux system)
MAVVPTKLYVIANFKETQLKRIRVGEPVKIAIDSVPGGPFEGRVESTQAGSGARFSLLPPENAVGNYVKVVQRVPVKIVFNNPPESEHMLGPGMSVVPSVRVSNFDISRTVLTMICLVAGAVLGGLWWRLAARG